MCAGALNISLHFLHLILFFIICSIYHSLLIPSIYNFLTASSLTHYIFTNMPSSIGRLTQKKSANKEESTLRNFFVHFFDNKTWYVVSHFFMSYPLFYTSLFSSFCTMVILSKFLLICFFFLLARTAHSIQNRILTLQLKPVIF